MHARTAARARMVAGGGLAAVLALAGTTDAQSSALHTRYVDATGSDSADGSVQTPWRTLQRAADAARAGDLIVVRPGVYANRRVTVTR